MGYQVAPIHTKIFCLDLGDSQKHNYDVFNYTIIVLRVRSVIQSEFGNIFEKTNPRPELISRIGYPRILICFDLHVSIRIN